MTQQTPHTIQIKVEEKPLAGLFYIRDKWLKIAKKTGKKIVLTYNNEKYIATYKEWMKGAKKMEKIFLIPDQPMILYGNYLSKFKIKEKPTKIEGVMNVVTRMPEVYRNQLRVLFKQ